MELHSILRGVVAYVEVRSGNDNRSAAISQELRQLGAQVEATFTDAVTHVVFKEGMKRTWNKATRRKVHLVSVSWIDSCKQNQAQVAEKNYAAARPEEVTSPLPRLNQAVRWKKMKSMQPCDFDEELARSAERGERKRKRIMMANRFTLNEDVTPTLSSPIPILALDTQAISSPLTSVSRTYSSPVPDTPPSMQKRLEKMRAERLALGTDLDESPPATPKALIDKQLQRRLLDIFSCDFMNTEESSSNDEASSRAVAKLINNLGSSSECGSQSSTDRKSLKPPASPRAVSELINNLGSSSECRQSSTDRKSLKPPASPRAVSELINNLGSSSECHQSSTDRKGPKPPACVKSAQDFSKATNAGQQTHSKVSVLSCPPKGCTEDGAEMYKKTNTSPDTTDVFSASKKRSGNSRLSMKESNDQNSPMIRGRTSLNKLPRNTENRSSRRSQGPDDNHYKTNKLMSSMSNALSPKDTNIDNPSLNANSTELKHTLGKVCPLSDSKLIKTFLNSDTTIKTSALSEGSLTGTGDCESAKTLKHQHSVDMGSEVKLIGPQLKHPGKRRLSSRQLVKSEVNAGPTFVSGRDSENKSTSATKCLQIPQHGIGSTAKSLSAARSETNKAALTAACGVSGGETAIECALNVVNGSKEVLDSMSLQSSSAASLKPMISRKKRNLLTGTALTSLLCSTETISAHKCSTVAAIPHKTTGQTSSTDMKSDISFMFGTTEAKDRDQKEDNTHKKGKRLSSKSTKSSITHLPSLETDPKHCTQNLIKVTSDSLSKAKEVKNTTSTYGLQNNYSLGDSVLRSDMSMSIIYENDTSTSRVTKAGYTRRSMDEFSTGSRTSQRVKKLKKISTQTSETIQETGPESIDNSIISKEGDAKIKSVRTNKNTQKLKRQSSVSSRSVATDKKAAKKSKDCHFSTSTDADNTLNESALSHQDSLTPVRLRHAHSLVMEQKFQPLLKRSTYSLVVTSLHREEQETVYSIVKKLGLFQMTNNVEATSTHIVCGEPRRTLNVLKAIARGCWLLRKEWVLESLEADMWLQEEPYEMTDFPTAVKSRSERQEVGSGYKVDLFSKLGAMFVSAVCTPPRKEIVHLINLCSGHVTCSETRAAIHLGDDHDPAKLVIKPAWILDCIMKLEILPTDGYIVSPKTLASQRESSPEY